MVVLEEELFEEELCILHALDVVGGGLHCLNVF